MRTGCNVKKSKQHLLHAHAAFCCFNHGTEINLGLVNLISLGHDIGLGPGGENYNARGSTLLRKLMAQELTERYINV